ncbi:MAG: hypothetical protein ABID38_01415 [Candidatus Diapherotrites archaeon]
MAETVIDKIYWITHPAFPLVIPKDAGRLTEEKIKHYFDGVLKPLVKKAQSEPNSLVVFQGTPTEVIKLDPENMFAALDLESELEVLIESNLKNRGIVVDPQKIGTGQAAEDVAEKERKQGLKVSKNAEVEGHGSWHAGCAEKFAKHYHERRKLTGPFRVSSKALYRHRK